MELGGITFNTFNACRLLRHFFDLVIIETVGVGQNEMDVHFLAEHRLLDLMAIMNNMIDLIISEKALENASELAS